MGRTKTPADLITINFRGVKYGVMAFGHSVPFSNEDKETVTECTIKCNIK